MTWPNKTMTRGHNCPSLLNDESSLSTLKARSLLPHPRHPLNHSKQLYCTTAQTSAKEEPIHIHNLKALWAIGG